MTHDVVLGSSGSSVTAAAGPRLGEGQLTRVRDGVTPVGVEAGAAARRVDNIIRFIIYNKL